MKPKLKGWTEILIFSGIVALTSVMIPGTFFWLYPVAIITGTIYLTYKNYE